MKNIQTYTQDIGGISKDYHLTLRNAFGLKEDYTVTCIGVTINGVWIGDWIY
jgi:hypothetical protein